MSAPASPADRALFFVAAAFNGLVVLALAVPGSPAWKLMGLLPPENPLFVHLFLVMAALFGAAYFWIALQPSGKNALIVTAIAGKLSVFVVILGHYLAGSAPATLPLLASGDFFFAALFIRFLYLHPEKHA